MQALELQRVHPRLLAYRPGWADEFQRVAKDFAQALGDVLDGQLEHIGSTAIPGMIAKPQIDMMAPIRRLEDVAAAHEVINGLGFALRPHRVDGLLYVAPRERAGDAQAELTHSVHFTTRESELWRERIAFRDAVRADIALRDAYVDLKLDLLSGPVPYSSGAKRDFVRRVLAGAGHELKDGLHARSGGSPSPG